MKIIDLLESPYLHDEELSYQVLGKISDSDIWGINPEHKTALLIATTKDLTRR